MIDKKVYYQICEKEIKHPELLQPINISYNKKILTNVCAKCRNKLIINKFKEKIKYKNR